MRPRHGPFSLQFRRTLRRRIAKIGVRVRVVDCAVPGLHYEEMHGIGRLLIYAGVFLAMVGVCVLVAEKLGLPLGRLPGDFAWKGKRSSVYFPLATCLLLSAILSLLMYILGRLQR